jgi:dinuclear metal center YbgI/SA1388 family protein
MVVRVQDIAQAVDRVAPFRLAYDWDNVGLQIGDPQKNVKNVGVGLEVTKEFLQFAQRRRCEVLLVHHPLIFGSLKRLNEQQYAAALICEVVRRKMALIVAHTNLDRVAHGTNGVWADLLKLEDRQPLEPCQREELFKFTVFVPTTHIRPVIDAIHEGGGGRIGNYSRCTFRAPGVGTYQPEAGANPYQGSVGKFEEAEEVRLEALVGQSCLRRVLERVRAVHPYEEMAYDIYPLRCIEPSEGLGIVGRLPKAMKLAELAKVAGQACKSRCVSYAGPASARVTRVAIVTGSAGSSVDLVTPSVADVVITGELGYHKALELKARGVGLICLGHAASEKVVAPRLAELVAQELGSHAKALKWHVFQDYDDPCANL